MADNSKKPEMTAEEFADNWSLGPEMKKAILADLRSVIRGKLVEFQKWDEEIGWVYCYDLRVDEFLRDNQ